MYTREELIEAILLEISLDRKLFHKAGTNKQVSDAMAALGNRAVKPRKLPKGVRVKNAGRQLSHKFRKLLGAG